MFGKAALRAQKTSSLRFWRSRLARRHCVLRATTASSALTRSFCLQPRGFGFAAGFKVGDLVLVPERQADRVPAVQETLFAEGIDLKLHAAAVRPTNLLFLEIDGDDGIGAALRVI